MIEVSDDHSDLLGQARDQGLRPTCLAFAASDLNAFANSTGHLSVEFLCHHALRFAVAWKPDQGFTVDSVLQAIAAPGQPAEESYPYLADIPEAPRKAPPVGLAPLFFYRARSSQPTCSEVTRQVKAGKVVGIVIAVSESLYYPKDGIIAFDPFVIPDLYHALIVVGLGSHSFSGEEYLLLRNSWGVEWGNQGYAWMPARHLDLHLHTMIY